MQPEQRRRQIEYQLGQDYLHPEVREELERKLAELVINLEEQE